VNSSASQFPKTKKTPGNVPHVSILLYIRHIPQIPQIPKELKSELERRKPVQFFVLPGGAETHFYYARPDAPPGYSCMAAKCGVAH
jgi:hypothetical protein